LKLGFPLLLLWLIYRARWKLPMTLESQKAQGPNMCMTFKLPVAQDGTVVAGRSMEFPVGMPTQLAVLPADYVGISSVAEGERPKSWTASHGVVGMGVFGRPNWLIDGINTAGVSAHILYMPGGYCTFRPARGDGTDVSQVDLAAYLLGTCSSIDEVKAAVAEINIIGIDPGLGFVPPIHCLIHDTTGSVAIEFHPDSVQVVDNPVSIATNAPFLDWHLTNLGNYLGMSAENPRSEMIGGLRLSPLGQGEGLRGVPADYTPPARFARLFSILRLLEPASDAAAAELLALHICNAFDIPQGAVRERVGSSLVAEVTVWDSVLNLSTPRYAYRMFGNPETYVVDLASVDFEKPERLQELRSAGSFTAIEV
jgi:choloylglycine hydrolase